jgi:hypothetical protein
VIIPEDEWIRMDDGLEWFGGRWCNFRLGKDVGVFRVFVVQVVGQGGGSGGVSGVGGEGVSVGGARGMVL